MVDREAVREALHLWSMRTDLSDRERLIMEAARLWLDPDYEAAAEQVWWSKGLTDGQWPTQWEPYNELCRHQAKAIVDAALGGSE